MGVELKNNLKQTWWKSMVYERDDTEGLDASILSAPVVLKHSGHEDTFTDPLVDCKSCKSRWRADQLLEDNKCPNCKSVDLTEPRPFNLMFKTAIGPEMMVHHLHIYDQKHVSKSLLILKIF